MTTKALLKVGMSLACVALVVLLAGLIFAGKRIYRSMYSETVTISDVSKPWQHRFSNTVGSLFNGHLRVMVSGHLNGSARIECAGLPIELTAGDINKYIDESEYWGSTCDVRFEPGSASIGQLSVRAVISLSPDWDNRPPILDEQGPVGCTGGWVTYFPQSDQKYSSGFYYRGQKDGEWDYFDQQGKILRRELWKQGALLQ
jgi:hypothetical protein